MSALIGTIVAFVMAGLAVLGLVPNQRPLPIPNLPRNQTIDQDFSSIYAKKIDSTVCEFNGRKYAEGENHFMTWQNDDGGMPISDYVICKKGKWFDTETQDYINNSDYIGSIYLDGNVEEIINSISVPGMSKYTDPDFGFSFWYPSGWKLGASPSNDSAIEVKEQQGKYPRTVTIVREVRSDGVIDASGACGTCSILKYYFDKTQHLWMQTKDEVGNGGATSPADISHNTIGGLHIFPASYRFGGSVVPLTAHNFLIVEGDDGGLTYSLDLPLTKTIIATDPSVATPVSAAEQIKIIQAEKNAYARQ